jgi:hypothetical protein
MFRRKQNQAVQLIGVHYPLGAQLHSDRRHCSQQSTSRGMQQQGGSKFGDAKMNPARRSQSLEGNLDNIGTSHVTAVGEDDKRKSLHSSHPHGLDVGNQQRGTGVVASFPAQGRRLQIIATPPLTIPAGHGSEDKVASSEKVHSQPASEVPPKTNYPAVDPKTDDDAFRVRTDTANSAMFDISYDL